MAPLPDLKGKSLEDAILDFVVELDNAPADPKIPARVGRMTMEMINIQNFYKVRTPLFIDRCESTQLELYDEIKYRYNEHY